ncbi:MAG: hypothetical protein ACRC0F_00820 [Cetobacterium sp.]
MEKSKFNIDNIIKKLEKSNLDENQKEIFEEFFSTFGEHYKKLINHMSKNIECEKVKNDNTPEMDIYSIVVKREEVANMKKIGFEIIAEETLLLFKDEEIDFNINNDFYNIASKLYYKGDYFDKEKYLDKKYVGKVKLIDEDGSEFEEEINYYIYDEEFQNCEFREKIEKIKKVFRKYEIEKSVGFHPFTSRMFYTYISNINLRDLKSRKLDLKAVDLLLEENNLEEFSQNMIPMWNLSLENIMPKTTTEMGNYKFNYHFRLESNREFVIPIASNEYEQILCENSLNIILENLSEKFTKVVIKNIDKSKVNSKLYSNKMVESYKSKNSVSRMRTKADIQNFIESYDGGIKIDGYEISNKPFNMNLFFETNFKDEKSIFIPEYKTKLYIKFQKNSTEEHYNDFLNFILQELRDAYPEIHWIGGI